jgi:pyruvate/2-oxoglutarate/acetoin dehydrogenase E1 component
MRELTYAAAINEGLAQAMELCPDVLVLGQLVNYSKAGIFGTTSGLVERFGPDRVQDFPVAESVMTTTAIGAAVAGMRPVLVHQRQDFMFYSFDAIANWLALWRFKSGGKSSLPVVIRTIVGKGWGQGPQHSKSVHAWFAHLPGLRVAMPATPHDAKGMMLESIFGENPVIFVEHRSLFSMKGIVPAEAYRVRFGDGVIRRSGDSVTLVAIGGMVSLAIQVAAVLEKEGIAVEVIDPRSLYPLDEGLIFRSVARTRRLVVADLGWEKFGAAAEIISRVCSKMGSNLLANPARVTLPHSHTPASKKLEQRYYPDQDALADAIRRTVRPSAQD